MALTLASNAITFTDNTALSSGVITAAQLSAGAVTPVKLSTNSLTWNLSGDIGINTSTPTGKLHITQTKELDFSTQEALQSTAAIVIEKNNGGALTDGIVFKNQFGSPDKFIAVNNQGGIQFFSLGYLTGSTRTNAIQFTQTGSILLPPLGGTVVNLTVGTDGILARATSDERLKENIVSIDNALQKVTQIDGKIYNWKNKEYYGERAYVGLIAQNVMSVVPELTYENPDGTYGVYYGETTALLINAVKELKQIIDTQTQTISALEARILTLENL